jgi:O-antigen ligase
MSEQPIRSPGEASATAQTLRQQLWLTAAVAGLGLSRYAVVPLPFELAMQVQTVIIVAILAAVAAAAARDLPGALRRLPGAVRAGLLLYAGAAVWGAGVGVLSGNPNRYVASQLVAMLLLPAAAVAFSGHRFGGKSLAAGLAVAVVVSLEIQVALPLAAPGVFGELGPAGTAQLRFRAASSGLAILALMCGVAWLAYRRSWLVGAAVAAAAALIVSGMSRGAWLATLCGLVSLLVLSLATGRKAAAAIAAAIATAGLAVCALLLEVKERGPEIAHLDFEEATVAPPGRIETTARSHSGSRALLLDAKGGGRGVRLLEGPQAGVVALEVTGWFLGPEGGRATVWVEARDAAGGRLERKQHTVPVGGSWSPASVTLRWPEAARRFVMGVRVSSGQWLVDDVGVRTIPSRMSDLLWQIRGRVSSLPSVASDPASDKTVRYRLDELRGVMSRWMQAGALTLIAGHGLGAQFPFENSVWTESWRPAKAPVSSYIHNVYVFFAFKLGVAGVAALCGLLSLAGWAGREAWRRNGRDPERWVLAAAAAVWVAFFVWGLTSPEIINFRVAPLLGALVAASAAAVRDEWPQ